LKVKNIKSYENYCSSYSAVISVLPDRHTDRHDETEICCFESYHTVSATGYCSSCKLYQWRFIALMIWRTRKLLSCPASYLGPEERRCVSVPGPPYRTTYIYLRSDWLYWNNGCFGIVVNKLTQIDLKD